MRLFQKFLDEWADANAGENITAFLAPDTIPGSLVRKLVQDIEQKYARVMAQMDRLLPLCYDYDTCRGCRARVPAEAHSDDCHVLNASKTILGKHC